MSLPMRRMRTKQEMGPEGKALLDVCPWDFEQLKQTCKEFQMRFQGFWTRIDDGTVEVLLRGMIVTHLFCCREDFTISEPQIRATYMLCEWILGINQED